MNNINLQSGITYPNGVNKTIVVVNANSSVLPISNTLNSSSSNPLNDTPIDTSNLPPNSSILTENIASLNPFKFSSEYHDSTIGLVYYNYRHYNPNDGRWLSRDPIAEKGDYNLYEICKNNTITQKDILGKIIDASSPEININPDQFRSDNINMHCCPPNHKTRQTDKGEWEYRTNEQVGESVPNGCSNPFFTDVGISFFHEDCNKHDICYDTCGSTQKYCDRIFGSAMMNRCLSINDMEERSSCFIAANRFYITVSFIGPFLGNFESAQDVFCKWTKCSKSSRKQK